MILEHWFFNDVVSDYEKLFARPSQSEKKEEKWVRDVSIPGINPDDLNATVTDRKIELKKGEKVIYSEFLPRWIDVDTISSSYSFGVLSFEAQPQAARQHRKVEIAQR